jgi:hypothetical protein
MSILGKVLGLGFKGSRVQRFRVLGSGFWMPAFAGMTLKSDAVVLCFNN